MFCRGGFPDLYTVLRSGGTVHESQDVRPAAGFYHGSDTSISIVIQQAGKERKANKQGAGPAFYPEYPFRNPDSLLFPDLRLL